MKTGYWKLERWALRVAWAMEKSGTGSKVLPVAIHTTFPVFLNFGSGLTSALSRLNLNLVSSIPVFH